MFLQAHDLYRVSVRSFIDSIIRISYEEDQEIINELQTEGVIPMEKYELMNSFEEHGYEIGIAIGEARGETIGEARGKVEGIIENTISNVKKMYNKNFNVQNISEILELDYAFVQKVISEHS